MSSTIGVYSRHDGLSHNHTTMQYPPPPVYSTQPPSLYPISSLHHQPVVSGSAGDYKSAGSLGSHRFSPPNSPHHRHASGPAAAAPAAGQFEQLAGMGLGFYNLLTEKLLYPCVVLRRQSQVAVRSELYHLQPFTLLPVAFKLHHNQGVSPLWKGVGSSILLDGARYGIETIAADMFLFPSFTCVVTTPFAIAAMLESVQSCLASEQPAVLDFVRNGWSRLAADLLGGPRDVSRRIAIWSLIPPTVCHSLAHYVLAASAKDVIFHTVRRHILRKHPRSRSVFDNFYPELFASFASGLLADGILYPLETVLHRLYLQGTRTIIDNLDSGAEVIPVSLRYSGLLNCFHRIVDDEGITGLYKGFGALLLQYVAHFALLRAASSIMTLVEETLRDREPAGGPGGSLPPSTASPPTHAVLTDRLHDD